MSETKVDETLHALRSTPIPEDGREFHDRMIDVVEALAREKADAVPQASHIAAGDWATVSLSEWFRNAQRGEVAENERDAALHRAEAAEKFKAYVHQCLDDAGIPTHPNGPHSAQGCRIGDRLDLLLGAREAAEKANAAERKERDDALQQLVSLETQLTLSDGELKAAEKERDGVREQLRAMCHANSDAEARWTLAMQERDALRADCERLSKLHEQDKVELARWRKAATELRNLFGTDRPMGSPHYYAEDFVRLHLRATLKDAEKP